MTTTPWLSIVSNAVLAVRAVTIAIAAAVIFVDAADAAQDAAAVDLTAYDPACGVQIAAEQDRLDVVWSGGDAGQCQVKIDLRPTEPLIEQIRLTSSAGPSAVLAMKVDPVTWMTVGTRQSPPGRPLELSKWQVFFDNPAKREHATHASRLDKSSVRVTNAGRRATVSIGALTVGPFRGRLDLTFYADSPLIHAEAVVSTDQDNLAITYDAGLLGEAAGWKNVAWMNHDRQIERMPLDSAAAQSPSRHLSVKHRTIVAESEQGSIACFSPPHQYQFPRDYTDNLGFVWCGRDHRGLDGAFGIGIRQHETGGGNWVPWCNAPPGAEQRLSVFYLLSSSDAARAVDDVLRYTRGDRFEPLAGHITFSSHYHMAISVAALAERLKGIEPPVPSLVGIFKDMGVQAVHLGEFHGDGHPKDPGPLRLREMESMMIECRRLSDDEFLLTPGEEANAHLGIEKPGQHPGHWMLYFPRPVYWTMVRGPGQPFVESDPKLGKVYHVGDRNDMLRLIQDENGLAWTAHPRIKASNWTPDAYRHEDFYLSDHWLGGAWKAMPSDLSRDKLGERCLDLLDDMCNWGQKKYLPGEVDIFKIDPTHELFGHMNINYLRLDRLPRFDEGWQPILDALRSGAFFTTTGEILIRDFTVGGAQSGQVLEIGNGKPARLIAELDWTFPPKFAEIISGDGENVYRQRIELADARAFDKRKIDLELDLAGRTWVRFEVWDVACNGAYTQPVWLEAAE